MQPAYRRSLSLRRLRAVAVAGAVVLGAGCFVNNEGLPPPAAFYYPTGLLVSPGKTTLYVTNSDFDLQYNGGTVLALDLQNGLLPRLTALSRALAGKMPLEGACEAFLSGKLHDPCEPNPCSADQTCQRNGEFTTAGCTSACGEGKCNSTQLCVDGVCIDAKAKFLNRNVILYPGPCGQLPILRQVKDKSGNDISVPDLEVERAVATTGAFISGAALVQRPDGPGARLFVPVRGDPSVTFLDITDERTPNPPDPFKLDCGGVMCQPAGLSCKRDADCCSQVCDAGVCSGSGTENRCSSSHRIGLDPFDNTRQLSLPVEPVGIAASEDGAALVIAHQTQRAVSLVVNRWPVAGNTLSRPTLEFLITGLPDGPTEVATVPLPLVIAASQTLARAPLPGDPPAASYAPGFLVTYRNAGTIDLFRFLDDAGSAPPRPFLTRVFQAGISTSADGKDSRGIAVDATQRQACEAPCRTASESCAKGCTGADPVCRASCARAELACVRPLRCTDIPLRIFAANRLPAALLTGKIETTVLEDDQGNVTGAFDVATIQDTVPLAFGASKVTVGTVIGQDGAPATRVFAAAFDSRLVFSYDPEARRVDAVIRTGRGPHPLVVDTDLINPNLALRHAFLFVGHFTDSYMGVVDLDMRNPDTFGTMFAAIGTPTPPKESK